MKPSIVSGKAFLESIGLKAAERPEEFSERISYEVDDEDAASRFVEEWNNYHFSNDDEMPDNDALYTIKNRDPQISMVTSALFDWNYLCRMCDWILAHKDLFGKKILDIGCGNGILSVFLASVFPDSRIIAADRNPYVIRTAEWLIKKHKIGNIDLRQIDAADITGEAFDTVFSSRTLVDNDDDCEEMEWTDTTESLCRNSELRSKRYADTIAGLVASGGCLISTELNGEWNQWGWMRILCSHDLVPIDELCGLFTVEELNGVHMYAASVFKTGKSLTASEGDRIFQAHQIPSELWNSDVTDNRYGLIKLHMLKDQLYKGYAGFVTNPEEGLDNYRYFSFEIWTIKNDPEHMLFRQTAHYKGKISVSEVKFCDANLIFNAALFDITWLAHDPCLTVYEVTSGNGIETLTKCEDPLHLFNIENDMIDKRYSILLNMKKE